MSAVRTRRPPPPAYENLSLTDLAWAAGFIDGDGCITLYKNGAFRKIIVTADSTDKELLDRLQVMFGGNITSKKKYKENHRDAWTWKMNGSEMVIAVLELIEPLMVCEAKKARARMILDEWLPVTPRNGYYTQQTREAKLDFERRFFEIGAERGSGGQRGPVAQR